MSSYFYNKWKNHTSLPIECLINMILLYRKKRQIIQFDISYYTKSTTKSTIREFADQCQNVVIRTDSSDNIVIYLKENQEKIEKKLCKIGQGSIESAFRTGEFADMLDPIFYSCKGSFPGVFKKNRIVQVLINVIKDESTSGSILVVMCDTNISKCVEKLYKHYLKISKQIEEIDKELQTSLTFHSKPGKWKESDEFVVQKYRKLPTL